MPFPAIIQFFFSRTPKCLGSYSWGYAYSSLGITGLEEHIRAIECKGGIVEVQWNNIKKCVLDTASDLVRKSSIHHRSHGLDKKR